MWELQPKRVQVDFGLEIGKFGRGAFGSEMHQRWVNDAETQTIFAKHFFVPISENVPLRALSTYVQDTLCRVLPNQLDVEDSARILCHASPDRTGQHEQQVLREGADRTAAHFTRVAAGDRRRAFRGSSR